MYRNKKGRFAQDPENRKPFGQFMLIVVIGSALMLGWQWSRGFEIGLSVENADAEVEIRIPTRIELLKDEIYAVAKMYGISGYQMERTIECESRFNNVQSTAYQNGVREDSWGLAQIHLPSWPMVTRDQAMDEHFAIEWMAKHWNKAIWYGYSRKLDKCV